MSALLQASRRCPLGTKGRHCRTYQLRDTVAVVRKGGRTRSQVKVEANLFARVARLFQSTANNLVSSAEDPEKLLDQVVSEMQADLVKLRQTAAQVMASRKMMEAKYNQAQQTADEWLRRAELAVQKEEDELAKEALRRRKSYQDNADGMKMQLDQQEKALDQLMGNTRMLEGKLTEAKSKKETLKARAASAKTSKQIQEMIGSVDTSSGLAAFNQMEEKVLAMEAEAESTQLLIGGDKIERDFAMLESGSVEDELAALKKGSLKGSSPTAGALPEGKPVTDAIDMELEALRSKAKA